MSEFNHEPIQEGVEHGPYKPYSHFEGPIHNSNLQAKHQFQGHRQAIYRARQDGSITMGASEKLLAPITAAEAKHSEANQKYHDELDEYEEMYQTENPLAGDVEPTGGTPEPLQHPHDAFMNSVHKQHGN